MIFKWENTDNPDKLKFRKEFNLDSIVKNGKSEYEKQLLLKSWVSKALPPGEPERDYSELTAFNILEDAKKGKKFWCTQYTQVFIQAGVALDFYTRKLGVDTESAEEDMHHGVADIWSDQFQKWYVVDVQNNLHYEKDGLPLSVLEIRNEYLLNHGIEIEGVIGNYEKKVNYNRNSTGHNTPSNYFWFFIGLRNNFFEKPGIHDLKALLWIDKHNKNKVWYRGGGREEKSYPHPMYESQFIKTTDFNKCFPVMKRK